MTQVDPSKRTLQLLYVINKLTTKAFDAESREALKFIILNDTINLVRYDRALLWSFEEEPVELLGVSGQIDIHRRSLLSEKWNRLMDLIPEKNKPSILTEKDFEKEKALWDELQERSQTTVIWLPIFADEKLLLGLWLELWHFREEPPPPQKEALDLLSEYLTPSYGIAWQKLKPTLSIIRFLRNYSHPLTLIGISFVISTFIVHVPLRVVAPCEVVPRDPFYVTAPLEGIIEVIDVKPGEQVKVGDPLFQYDKRVIEKNLEVAAKKVEIAASEWSRAQNLGQRDPELLSQVAVLKLKLDKERLERDLAQYEFDKSTVKAEVPGVALLDDPDSWRGKPVKVGEKVMVVTDPTQTKLKIWIPESDNVWINPEIPIKVILNTRPEETQEARLIYVSNKSTLNEKEVASFVAEAEWIAAPEEVKLGVRGTAILYGDNVSLFYYITRKPWSLVRYFLGV